ncbi:MAG TPA: ABC transporter ATP-binding protein [Leptolyngbyaceae cyanobacterium M33_DOE_097]|uniref:ABC transporter ATP-binding protein n=1 Tax=Oscillatoriales cyanobacterium SpSt-418 TaxID=2282169 RepID=A0A7C3KDL7_9CYAN|nr:ABC transporter ATP-binding protein [Leptolyngbyaceae cyanobacterium M33_DOE_097]
MTEPVLQVQDLEVEFKTDFALTRAVKGISFEILPGQTLGIVGESGSGKSVTSLAVMGLVPPPGRITRGKVLFRGRADQPEPIDLLTLPPKRLESFRGGEISMIFQEPMSSLNPVYTIGFQITEAIQLHKRLNKADAEREAIALLQEVRVLPNDEEMKRRYVTELQYANPNAAIPGDRELDREINRQKYQFLKRYPHQLSGGQMQRVMIAMAISCDPVLLIADEPTTALDVTVQATILDLLRDLRDQRGMSIMFITHDLGIIAEIADQVAVMYQGDIVESGSVWQIFSDPQHPYTKGLLTCRPRLDRRLRRLPTVSDFMEVNQLADGTSQIQERQIGVDEALTMAQEVSASDMEQRLTTLHQKQPLLKVEDLRVAFPVKNTFGQVSRYVMAVNGVSFEVYPGETLGLVGESGCGKSTLARAILQLIPPTSGHVWFNGQDVTHLSPGQLRRLRREMQIIFQNPYSALDSRMKVGAAVMEPMQIHDKPANRNEQRQRAIYLLERVGLDASAINRYPHQFSGGQRQRICIARALALNPQFIICDESVSALDVSVQAQVLNLLKELQNEFNLTYIFISHDLSVVKFMSDRIIVMNKGQVEEVAPAESLYQAPTQDYTRKLISAIPIGNLDRIREQQERRGITVS